MKPLVCSGIATAIAALILLGLATGCGAQAAPPQAAAAKESSSVYSPREAIAAASRDETGASGVFEFKVASIGGGAKGRAVFLNSEEDYRDPKNLTVMVRPAAVKAIEAKLGKPLDKAFNGKRVRVTGTAQKAKINLYDADNKRTGETETQVRITVTEAASIVVR